MSYMASGVGGREVQKNSFHKIPKIRNKKILRFLNQNMELLFIFDKVFSELEYQKLGGMKSRL